jgi:hypothetical protein
MASWNSVQSRIAAVAFAIRLDLNHNEGRLYRGAGDVVMDVHKRSPRRSSFISQTRTKFSLRPEERIYH